jgi:hypothetical protein
VGNGLYCGVVGLVRVPILGAQRNGAIGFASGVVKGAAGLISKPVVGVLDAVTHTAVNDNSRVNLGKGGVLGIFNVWGFALFVTKHLCV